MERCSSLEALNEDLDRFGVDPSVVGLTGREAACRVLLLLFRHDLGSEVKWASMNRRDII